MNSPLQTLSVDSNAQTPAIDAPAPKRESLAPGAYVFSPEDANATPCDSEADTEAGSPSEQPTPQVRVPMTMFKKMYADRHGNAPPVPVPVPETPGTKTRNWIAELKAQGEQAAAQCKRMDALEEGEEPPASGISCETPCAAPLTAAASSNSCTPPVAQSITAAVINTADPAAPDAATGTTTASKDTAVAVAASVAPISSAISSSGGSGGDGGAGGDTARRALEQAHAAKLGELRGSLHSQHAMEINLIQERADAALAKEREACRAREAGASAEVDALRAQLNAASASSLETERRFNAEVLTLKATVTKLEEKRGRLEGATQHYSEQNAELRAAQLTATAELRAATSQVATLEGAVTKKQAALEASEARRVQDVAAMKAAMRTEAEAAMSTGNTRYRELQGHYKRKKAALEETAPKLVAAEAAVRSGAEELAKVKAAADDATTELKAARRELETLRPRVAEHSAAAHAAEAKVTTLTAQLKEQAAAAASAATDGAAAIAAAEASAGAQATLESEKNTLKVRIFDATQRTGELEAQLAESRKKEKELEAICEELMALAESNKKA